MGAPIKTVSLREEDYYRLREQAEREGRTIQGQVRYLLRFGEAGE